MTTKTRSQIARGAKKKGARGERQLAKLFSDWWGCDFHRTPSSGGLRWKSNQAKTRGDLVSDDPDFMFSVEAKNRENWEFSTLFQGKGPIFEWWEQCLEDAGTVGKVPLLCITKNRQPWYVVTLYPVGKNTRNFMVVRYRETTLKVCLLSSFIRRNPKDSLIGASSEA